MPTEITAPFGIGAIQRTGTTYRKRTCRGRPSWEATFPFDLSAWESRNMIQKAYLLIKRGFLGELIARGRIRQMIRLSNSVMVWEAWGVWGACLVLH